MEKVEKKITQRTVLLVTGFTFLFISIAFLVISYVIRKNPAAVTDDENTDVSLNASTSVYESEGQIDKDYSVVDDSKVDASNTFAESEDSSEESEYSESEESNDEFVHGWVINEFGYTYLYGDCGYEQFNYKSTAMNRYINGLNAFADVISQNSRLFNITVPVSSTFASIPREIYIADNFYNQSQTVFVAEVESKLNEKFVNIDVVSELEERYDNGEYVFFRTDKNWTSLGAYSAYSAFCEKAGIVPYPFELFQNENVGSLLGSFYNATGSVALFNNPDEMICYKTIPTVRCSLTVYDSGKIYNNYNFCDNKVNAFTAIDYYLGREAERYEISTTAEGGSLLIVGDTSVYAIAPYLASHYSRIDIINPEKFGENIQEFLSKRNYDDIITMCYSTNAVNGDYMPSFNAITGVKDE